MQINALLILLISHIIGDFYLQNNKLAQLKDRQYSGVVIHSVLYCIPFILMSFFTDGFINYFKISLLACLSHFIIDSCKYYAIKSYKIYANRNYNNIVLKTVLDYIKDINRQRLIYIVDQGIHILIIILLCYVFKDIYLSYYLSSSRIFRWTLIMLCIYRPANITFYKLFAEFKPVCDITSNSRNKKAGSIIGLLERVLIVVFLYLGQYSSVGLTLTAKSIARYNMISENKEFAEYYLIGTLYSVIISLILFLLIL